MNTAVLLAVADHSDAAKALDETRAFIEDCERRFSRFLPESEISILNAAAGNWHRASADMIDMLLQSIGFHRETEGLFDPSILPDLKQAGYDRSMDEIRTFGAKGRMGTRQPRSLFEKLEVDAESGWVRLPSDMQLDLGGIAKGWIVEKAVEILSVGGTSCAVSAGGDILFRGYPGSEILWPVRVEDPWNPDQEVTRLEVGPGAVATSSIVKRSWLQAGERRHHLIDPRTGRPADTTWASVTVLTDSIIVAEVYAKSLLIGGEAEADRLLQRRPRLSFIAVGMDGHLVSSFEHAEHF